MSENISFETTIRVRYCEVDKMGVLHHSRYLAYFEIGRTEFLRTSGFSYREFEDAHLYLVIVKVSCNYKYPIRYDDVVRVITTLKRMTPAKIEHTYEIWNEDKSILHAAGESTLACVDDTGTLQRIPDFLLNLSYPSPPKSGGD
ncbi:MAG: thioesterase family protein [Candidatus Auribacterota bacterium]